MKFREVLFALWLGGALSAGPVWAGNFYANTSPTNVPWPGGVVPYEFTNTLSAAEQATFLNGLREWELAANVTFVPHTNQTRWILFSYNTNFLDYVAGGSYSPQLITISSLSRAQVCHEMGHSFGLTHENIRPDAPHYVLVITNNIEDEATNIYWFTPDPTSVTNGPYDFESVMHLGWDFVSVDFGVLPTQQPHPPYFKRYQFRMGNYCLSPGDRAALAYLYGPPATPLTNVVTSTADYGPGSLRAAIYYATDHPGSTVRFNIPISDSGYSNGVFYVHLTGQLPPLVANGMVIDGTTQPGYAGQPLIILDGSQVLPQTFTSDTGLLLYSASNQVKGLSFSGFNWNGLTMLYSEASNNVVSGCWFGLASSGKEASSNLYQGILIENAGGNIIGGTATHAGNVLSGNAQYGLYITGSNAANNVALGNFFGTDPSGSLAVPNALSGVLIGAGASGNILGGTNPLARNVLSGNAQYGLWMTDLGTSNNVVLGNYIGTTASGSQALGNGYGGLILINATSGNTIGGPNSSARNIISGNTNAGLWLLGSGTAGNIVQGNFFGLNASGNAAVPNTFVGMYLIEGAQSNQVLNNVFSGQPSEGLRISDAGTSANVVQGNFMGTDSTGSNAIPNEFAGLNLQNGATHNVIGGVLPGQGNVVAFNYGPGIVLYDAGTTNNAIRGNSIFSNGYLGINFNNTTEMTNHTGYLAGPNDFQNYPVITNAFGEAASTFVSGKLNSLPGQTYFIDVFRSAAPDPSSYGEGQFYLGTVSVTTDNSGNAAFAFDTAAGNFSGQYLTATATSPGGDTSEFSLAMPATNSTAPGAQLVGPFGWGPAGFSFSIAVQTNHSYHLQSTTNLAARPVVWTNLASFTATQSSLVFTDRTAAASHARFYRITSP